MVNFEGIITDQNNDFSPNNLATKYVPGQGQEANSASDEGHTNPTGLQHSDSRYSVGNYNLRYVIQTINDNNYPPPYRETMSDVFNCHRRDQLRETLSPKVVRHLVTFRGRLFSVVHQHHVRQNDIACARSGLRGCSHAELRM